MRRRRNNAQRLRSAVDVLPHHTRVAMLRGIDSNSIIVGAYTDRDGGVCPMLAAHRNGGRTSFASFARAWDAFTGARKKPRRASRREIRALRAYLEMSLLEDEVAGKSLTQIADRIRAEREAASPPRASPDDASPHGDQPSTDRERSAELRHRRRWSWLRPTRRYDTFQQRLAAAEEELSEERAAEVSSAGSGAPTRHRVT